jgi:cytochrome c-type biogenesis protein CcmH
MKFGRVMTIVLAVGVAAVAAAIALGAGRGPDPNAVPTLTQVQERVMSPFCPGLLLEMCPSTQAVELRGRIQKKIDAGWNNRQIDRWLAGSYGEAVLAKPKSASSWLPPALAIVAGGLVVAATLRRRKPGASPPAPEVAPLTGDDKARLQSDLAAYAERQSE